jgi:hypothetical protein
MASANFYKRFIGAQPRLNPQPSGQSVFSQLSGTCSTCGSPKLKIIFKAEASKIHSFFEGQACHLREPIV